MKHFLVFWMLCIPLTTIYAQTKREKIAKNVDDIEVVFKDGSSAIGYIKNLWNPIALRMPFESFERQFGFLDNKFTLFLPDGSKRKITSDEVRSIFAYAEDGSYTEMRRLGLKRVDSKGTIKDLKKNAWLPVTYKSDHITILSYNYYIDINDTGAIINFSKEKLQYQGTQMYLQRNDEDFAIAPIDMNAARNPFLLIKLTDRITNALKETFRDCDLLVQQLNEKPEINRKEIIKESRAKLKETSKQIKSLPKDERNDAWDVYFTRAYLNPYIDLITSYDEQCPKN